MYTACVGLQRVYISLCRSLLHGIKSIITDDYSRNSMFLLYLCDRNDTIIILVAWDLLTHSRRSYKFHRLPQRETRTKCCLLCPALHFALFCIGFLFHSSNHLNCIRNAYMWNEVLVLKSSCCWSFMLWWSNVRSWIFNKIRTHRPASLITTSSLNCEWWGKEQFTL